MLIKKNKKKNLTCPFISFQKARRGAVTRATTATAVCSHARPDNSEMITSVSSNHTEHFCLWTLTPFFRKSTLSCKRMLTTLCSSLATECLRGRNSVVPRSLIQSREHRRIMDKNGLWWIWIADERVNQDPRRLRECVSPVFSPLRLFPKALLIILIYLTLSYLAQHPDEMRPYTP